MLINQNKQNQSTRVNLYLSPVLLLLFSVIFFPGYLTAQKSEATSSANIETISIQVFEAKINQEAHPQIVDTRLPEEYAYNHLLHAVNVDVEGGHYQQQVDLLEKNRPVFVYAIGNGRSAKLAAELADAGYTKIYVLNGGIGGWIGNGKPIFSSVKDGFTLTDLNAITDAHPWVLVDLHTRYCPGCRKLQPTVDSLIQEYGNTLKVVKIDVYDNPVIAGIFKVPAIPTLIVYKNGSIVWQKTGAGIYKEQVEKVLAAR